MAAAAQRSSDVKYSQQNNLKFESREQYRSKTVKQSDLDSHRLFVIMEEQGHLFSENTVRLWASQCPTRWGPEKAA